MTIGRAIRENGDSIDMARTLDGRLVIFGVDADGRLFQRFETATGSGA